METEIVLKDALALLRELALKSVLTEDHYDRALRIIVTASKRKKARCLCKAA